MKKTLRERIEAVVAMNVAALQEEHREVFGKEPVSWRLQPDEEGRHANGLRELARAIARNTPLRQRVITNAGKRRTGLPPEQTAVATIEPDHDPRLPMPGGWIMKHYKGKTHVVQVLDDGRFSYDDRRYTSLSAIAQEITGTKWNGLLFFGLTEKKNGRS